MRAKPAILLLSIFALALVALPASTLALSSWYGANYSYDYNFRHNVATCDQESDGNGAYARFSLAYPNTYQYRVDDGNGSQPGCGTAGAYASTVWRHRTCEDQAFQPDPCGGWVFP